MIIDFKGNTGGGGGSGTTNYNQLTNKPQINGVTLSGNVSSDQLGITPNELKAVENVPSAATNGSVFAEYREGEIGYGWQEPNNTTGNTFHYLNTYNVEQYDAHLADVTYNNEVRDIMLYGDNRRILFGFQYTTYSGDLLQVERGATGSTEAWEGVYVIVNFTNVDLPEISFVDGNGDPVDVVISNEVTPYSEPLITKELKQAYNQTSGVSRWDKYGDEYDGRYQLYQFKPLEGFSFPSEKTFIGQVHYYDIVIKAYTNSGFTYAVDCSTDSGETWAEYVIPCDGASHQYNLTGSSTAKVMNATFKADYFPLDPDDLGYFNIEADKFMWWDNLVVLTKNVLYYDTFLKKGNLMKWYNYADGRFMYAREDCTNDGDYLVHVGAEIEGSRLYAGVTINNGVITNAGYGGVDNLGDGHWAGSKEDTNGVSYFFHCWVEDGYLYWQTSSPIMNLDAYGTGSDRQGGILMI